MVLNKVQSLHIEKAPYLKKVRGFLRYLERSVGALVSPKQLTLALRWQRFDLVKFL